VSKRGYVKTQNITDPDSAKMKTSHGVIQGYTGVAAVDDRDQVIVYAEAFGEGQEQSTLAPVLEGLSEHLKHMGETLTLKRITADAGYHSEANVELLYMRKIDGYLADTGGYSLKVNWLYLAAAVATAVLSHHRQRKSFYYAGLVNSGLALYLIADGYHWKDQPWWAVLLVGSGLVVLVAGFVLDARERRRA